MPVNHAAVYATNPHVTLIKEFEDKVEYYNIKEELVEVNQELIDAWVDPNTWLEARREAYPDWQDQLDMQYHDEVNNTTTWKDAITKIKLDNPKPE
tara:strand:- start:8 stop:295 length:288 start_codon:yes stop_codon:yes gene_type:complete